MIFSVRGCHLLALLLVMSTCWYALPADTRTTSTTSEPNPVVEDTLNSATSESSEEENPCEQCYDRVENAQTFISVQLELLERQKYLIRQKQKSANANSIVKNSTTKRPRMQQNQTASGRSRSLLNNDNSDELIVVSRLRVARSTESGNPLGRTQSVGDVKPRRKSKKNINPELKQLEHKQKQNLNETCKSLYELKNCLTESSSECVGDLQYHSFDIFYDQWMTKFNCPPINNPGFKPLKYLTRSIPQLDREKVPVARPITSPEEVQKRLDAMFGGRPALGVMLKPTLTMSATQKFNSINSGESQQQQQQFDGDVYSQTKERHLLIGNSVLELKVLKQSGTQLKPMTSQLIIIPGLLIVMLALLTLVNRYYKATPQKA